MTTLPILSRYRNGPIVTHLDQPTSISEHSRRFDEFHGAAVGPRPVAGSLAVAIRDVDCAERDGMLRLWCLFALLTVGLLFSGRAFGQGAAGQPGAAKYKAEALPPELARRQNVALMSSARSEGLSKKSDLTEQWANFRYFSAYYQRYLFGKLKDPAFSAEYGQIAQSMLDDLDRSQRTGTPAARLLSEWIVAGASVIAADNYHPTARVNATLLLALVDQQAADLRALKPPVPARAALSPLFRLYTTESNPDGVRAAALQGLARHVQLGALTNPDHRKAVAGPMLQLAKSDPPATRSAEAHAFMQRYAIDMLSILADPNAFAETAQTLVSLSTAKEKPSLIAAYAASKVGQFQPGKAKVNQPSKVLDSWAARAAQAIDQELERIARLDPPVPVRDQPAMPTEQTRRPTFFSQEGGDGMDDGYDPGSDMDDYTPDDGMDGGMDDYDPYDGGGGLYTSVPQVKPQPLEVVTSRRRINHLLQQLHMGVTGQSTAGTPSRPAGLLAVATEPEKAAFEKWIKTVSEVIAAINADTLDERPKFVEELKAQSVVLKNLAGMNVAAEEPSLALDLNLDAFTAPAGPMNAAAAGPAGGGDPAGPGAQAPAPGPRNGQAPAGANPVPDPQPPRAGPNPDGDLLDGLAP